MSLAAATAAEPAGIADDASGGPSTTAVASTTTNYPVWFPATAALALDRFLAAVRRGSELGSGTGGARRGGNVTFRDHRPYAPGDELSRLDWNIYGRLGQLHIKTYTEERAAGYDLLLDLSPSMRADAATTLDAARCLAAALGYLALARGGNQAGTSVRIGHARPESALRLQPARHSRAGVQALLRDLASDEIERTPSDAAFHETLTAWARTAAGAGTKTRLAIITDGFEATTLQRALREAVRSRRAQEVLVLLVTQDPALDIDPSQPLQLIDAETGERRDIAEPARYLDRVREAHASFVDGWTTTCARLRVACLPMSIGPPPGPLVESLCAGLRRIGWIQ